MGRLMVAIRAFFVSLYSSQKARQIREILESSPLPKIDAEPNPQRQESAQQVIPARSEAITLLAALQREARLVDLVKQPLGQFSDEQIGSAARDVLAGCASALDRFFALQPVTAHEEGTTCDVPMGYDPAEFKLAGHVEGRGPFRGKLAHTGWRATTVKLPTWTGSKNSALIIAPAEVEVSPRASTAPQP
jgi:hypothetical protein